MEIVIIGLLILLNGFFALSEIALISSRKTRLERMKSENRIGAKSALLLLEKSEDFLSAIQVGITLIGILTGVFGGLGIADDVTPFIEKISIFSKSAYEISLFITILIITYFSILIGELVPKTIALSNPEKIACRVAPVIFYFSLIFFPVVRVLSFSTLLINKLLRIRKHNDHLGEAELRQLLKTASHQGIIEKEQDLIHEKVFYFSDKKAKHIMTHRREVEWIDINKPAKEIREQVMKSTHSRLICSRGNIDDFAGILSIRDFLALDRSKGECRVQDLLIQPIIIPESAEAYKVLKFFREKQVHFCIVVNEYGSIEGIITLHDILENLIGDIPEEGEKYEPDIFIRDDKSYLVSGDASVEILDSIFENHITDLENVEFTTVAGFVLSRIDKVPQIGDKFTFNDYLIEIVDIDGKRIDKILISKKTS